ncbi:histidine utilization repressor [Verticiella sediminum]|uniref:Histidine utilization repressor n=1 Tax=Verticiella sediminum TaxID=1247510 RepID=A0A556A7J1_9BURK|nr:histidine utilization repressor [Verticiella sediminum]TSH88838.1 histidine utilization repressor [Verticiella sediminum]
MAKAAAPVALYVQMKDAIREAIAQGHWRPGDRVPSEHELTREYGVSRMTANRVLRELTAEGLILRTQGVGSFVAELQPIASVLHMPEIQDDIAARGHAHSAHVLVREKIASDADLAAAMGLRSRTAVFSVTLVHREDGVPVQLEERFVNPAVCPDFLAFDFDAATPGRYLAEHAPLTEAEQAVEAVAAPAAVAQALDVAEATPCLLVRRRVYCGADVACVVRLWHPGGRFRLTGHFKP